MYFHRPFNAEIDYMNVIAWAEIGKIFIDSDAGSVKIIIII